MQAQEDQSCADRMIPRQARYIFDTGSAVILRQCHLGDKACFSNFAHAPTRRRWRPPRGAFRSGEREEAGRGRSAPRSGHPGEKRRKSRKCWPLVQSNSGPSCIRTSCLYLYPTISRVLPKGVWYFLIFQIFMMEFTMFLEKLASKAFPGGYSKNVCPLSPRNFEITRWFSQMTPDEHPRRTTLPMAHSHHFTHPHQV